MSREDDVIQKLISLGEKHDSIRAMILFSSRTNPDVTCDIFSDYDVEFFAGDPAAFGESDEWFEELGPVLIVYREEPGGRSDGYTRLVLYEDGTKIDFGVNNIHKLEALCREDTLPPYYDIGYEVLLDKGSITVGLKKPTYRAFIPSVPTEAEYVSAVNEFWWNSTYVSKYIWRDDLMAAKFMFEHWLCQSDLRRMLEWSIEIERGWSWKPGHYGRGLTKELDPETRKELIATYAGGNIEELWESLFRTAALFRRIAIKVAEGLDYTYSDELDRKIMTYHHAVKDLDRKTTNPTELAILLRNCFQGL